MYETIAVFAVNFLLGCLAGATAGMYINNKYLEEKEDAEFEQRYLDYMHG